VCVWWMGCFSAFLRWHQVKFRLPAVVARMGLSRWTLCLRAHRYPHTSIEAQIRILADLAFMLQVGTDAIPQCRAPSRAPTLTRVAHARSHVQSGVTPPPYAYLPTHTSLRTGWAHADSPGLSPAFRFLFRFPFFVVPVAPLPTLFSAGSCQTSDGVLDFKTRVGGWVGGWEGVNLTWRPVHTALREPNPLSCDVPHEIRCG
jgi:hypothetical protein